MSRLGWIVLLCGTLASCASVGPLRTQADATGLDLLADCRAAGLPCQIGVVVERCREVKVAPEALCATVCLSVLGQDPVCAESPLQ